MKRTFVCILLSGIFSLCLGQENYEIQVYGSQTQRKNSAIVELHSNYTFVGQKDVVHEVRPPFHSFHETLEITQGISDIFEIGFYLFTNGSAEYGYQFVGTHIRPRIMAPARWNLPVGLSLSTEFGYQRPAYAEETWNVELRPIIDKQFDRLYLCFNPTCGVALKSKYSNSVPVFEPNIKASYAVVANCALGIEYYGDLGPVNSFEPMDNQGHTVFAAFDLLNNVHWELNAGIGFGLTTTTDGLVAKVLVGRRLYWGE